MKKTALLPYYLTCLYVLVVIIASILDTAVVYGFIINSKNTIRATTTPTTILQMTTMDQDQVARLAVAANEARGIAMDAIAQARSGYLNIPLADAEIGAVLYGSQMKYNPRDPQWINRDRFILSAGQGSMFLYAWLHLAGFDDLTMQDIQQYRQMHSKTPGYPEFGTTTTPGVVEATTGPLGGGEGVANAVGMAASAKMAAATYNTDHHNVLDHHIFCLASEGCLQEGVSAEASAWAGHERLDNLILLYSACGITCDRMAEYTQSEDILLRYQAYGWEVHEIIDGHDLEAVDAAIALARVNDNGKPKLIKCNTIAGKGMEEIEGTNAAFGEAGVPYIDKAKRNIGLPADGVDGKWFVSKATRDYFTSLQKDRVAEYNTWQETFALWAVANPALAQQLERAKDDCTQCFARQMLREIPPQSSSSHNEGEASRVSASRIMQWIAKLVPHYVSGSADLMGSTRNYIRDGGNFGYGFDKTYAGKNLYFGKREHAMGSIMNGFAYHGLFKISGATWLPMLDYMRLPTRIAALSKLGRVSYILTHDSVATGCEGPLHQAYETVSNLRDVPNLDVYRPADAEETVAAMVASVTRHEGPTALILSWQRLGQIKEVGYMIRREGAMKGGYIVKREVTRDSSGLIIVIATGSEVQLALETAKDLAYVRVVSMPCVEVFERQSDAYVEEVLPLSCTHRIVIEGGVTRGWYKYASEVMGIDTFGFSGPSSEVAEELGMTAGNLRSRILQMRKDVDECR